MQQAVGNRGFPGIHSPGIFVHWYACRHVRQQGIICNPGIRFKYEGFSAERGDQEKYGEKVLA